MQTINEPGRIELDLGEQLRKAILADIERRGSDYEQLGEKLGLLPSGVEALLRRQVWPVTIAMRVAERLGIPINIDVGRSLA
jgi:hypothetical protein